MELLEEMSLLGWLVCRCILCRCQVGCQQDFLDYFNLQESLVMITMYASLEFYVRHVWFPCGAGLAFVIIYVR